GFAVSCPQIALPLFGVRCAAGCIFFLTTCLAIGRRAMDMFRTFAVVGWTACKRTGFGWSTPRMDGGCERWRFPSRSLICHPDREPTWHGALVRRSAKSDGA